METFSTTDNIQDEKQMRQKAAIPLLWVSIVAMIMLFAAFTSAYVVSREKAQWLHFEMPQMFYISTAVILLSSVAMNWAWMAAKKNNYGVIKTGLLITFLLGATFILLQFLGWKSLFEQKIVFAGKYSNPAGSYFYVLTFMHLLHLLGGIIAVLVVYFKSLKNRYNSENLLGLKLCSIFWHFLGVLWVYLFLFLLFIR